MTKPRRGGWSGGPVRNDNAGLLVACSLAVVLLALGAFLLLLP